MQSLPTELLLIRSMSRIMKLPHLLCALALPPLPLQTAPTLNRCDTGGLQMIKKSTPKPADLPLGMLKLPQATLNMHKCTHTHTHTETRMLTTAVMHKCKHTQTYRNTSAHHCIDAQMHTHTHTHTHAYRDTNAHHCSDAQTHTHIQRHEFSPLQ